MKLKIAASAIFLLRLFECFCYRYSANAEIHKSAIRDRERLWPNGRVPYVISSDYKERERRVITMAIRDIHRDTCVRFVPRTNEKNYVKIMPTGQGCFSMLGMVGGEQTVSLDRVGCTDSKVTPIHELMHAIGFIHEQGRSDRDQHVQIHHKNINPESMINFIKLNKTDIQHLGVPYDHDSVMHYESHDFGINTEKPTITRKNGSTKLGNVYGMTKSDILKVNRLYHCNPNDTCWDDDVTECRYLIKKHGATYCTTNREEMARDCKRSCGLCKIGYK